MRLEINFKYPCWWLKTGLGTRDNCRDKGTMFLGQTVVACFFVAKPVEAPQHFLGKSYKLDNVVTLSSSRCSTIVWCPARANDPLLSINALSSSWRSKGPLQEQKCEQLPIFQSIDK